MLVKKRKKKKIKLKKKLLTFVWCVFEELLMQYQANYCVVCTIHQPRYNIFELFGASLARLVLYDDTSLPFFFEFYVLLVIPSRKWLHIHVLRADLLMVLSGGQVIYFGRAREAVAYFSHLNFQCPKYYNPADYFSMHLCLVRSAKRKKNILL